MIEEDVNPSVQGDTAIPEHTFAEFAEDPRALSFARKAIVGGGLIGVASCSYGIFFAGPAGNFSPYEWITVPLMGIFSIIVVITLWLSDDRYLQTIGFGFTTWLGFYLFSNFGYELFVQPDLGNVMIYLAWLPVVYLFSTTISSLRTAMLLSGVTVSFILALFIAYVATHTIPAPGANHIWDAVVVSIMAQPALLGIIYGVGRYREYYVSERAKLELMAENTLVLEKAAEEARQGRLAAEQANDAKDQFLSNITHELRTPLNSILGLVQVLDTETKHGPHSHTRDYIGGIKDSGEILLGQIDDILALSHLNTQASVINESSMVVALCLFEDLPCLEDMPGFDNHTLTLEIPSNLPALYADRSLVTKMCHSLLSNAVKFSPSKSLISLGVDLLENGDLRIRVSDEGVGIPAENLPHIGGAFYQVDGSATREHSGLGLGLALASARMALHGGHFEIGNRSGRGTKADLIFPATRVLSGQSDLTRQVN